MIYLCVYENSIIYQFVTVIEATLNNKLLEVFYT